MAMAQNPVPPIPTKIPTKMDGAPTQKWDSIGFDLQSYGQTGLGHSEIERLKETRNSALHLRHMLGGHLSQGTDQRDAVFRAVRFLIPC